MKTWTTAVAAVAGAAALMGTGAGVVSWADDNFVRKVEMETFDQKLDKLDLQQKQSDLMRIRDKIWETEDRLTASPNSQVHKERLRELESEKQLKCHELGMSAGICK